MVGVNAPMKSLARNGPPLPEDGLSVVFSSTGVNLRPVESLPEIRDADVRVQANGRAAKIEISRAAMETPQGNFAFGIEHGETGSFLAANARASYPGAPSSATLSDAETFASFYETLIGAQNDG